MELVNFVKGLTEVVDFTTREVDGRKSVLSAVALRSNQVKYFPMELVDIVKGVTEVVVKKMPKKSSQKIPLKKRLSSNNFLKKGGLF